MWLSEVGMCIAHVQFLHKGMSCSQRFWVLCVEDMCARWCVGQVSVYSAGRCPKWSMLYAVQFQCSNELLYLNFTSNISYYDDTYKVTGIDYNMQTLSLVPEGSATCRPFDADRFGGLNITNTTTLLLDCPTNITESCTLFPSMFVTALVGL